jgi:hypothetical protein
MKQAHLKFAFGVVTAGVLVGVGAVAVAAGGGGKLDEALTGYQEVPALSTTGAGEFHATIDDDGNAIHYRLTFSALESDATQAHVNVHSVGRPGGEIRAQLD